MKKHFFIIYEDPMGNLSETYRHCETQQEAVKDFYDKNAEYGYKIISIYTREMLYHF